MSQDKQFRINERELEQLIYCLERDLDVLKHLARKHTEFIAKCSRAGRKASDNMTAEERIERATKASRSRK